MNYSVEKAKKSTVKIKITIPTQEWEQAQVVAYNKSKSKYTLPGFRKGHVPMNVIEKNYGKGVFFEDAINNLFGEHYYAILEKEQSIDPVARPDLEVDTIDENGLTMTATVIVKPEVEISAYTGITFEKVEYNVEDADVDEQVNHLLSDLATDEQVEGRVAENGDIALIDYSGAIDGVKFDGGTAEKQTLTLGSGMFIPGFEPQVVGMEIGQTKDIEVTFPEDYGSADLKGKKAVFTVTLHGIKVKKTPELTEEIVAENTVFKTIEEFKASIVANLEKQNAEKAKREIEDNMIKTISQNATVEIPDALIDNQVENMVHDMEYRMMYQGLKLEDYLKYTNQTLEAYKEGFKAQAGDQVKSQLVIDKIITDEKLDVTEDELETKIEEMAKESGKSLEEYKGNMQEKQKKYIENNLVIEKLFEFLFKNNTVA